MKKKYLFLYGLIIILTTLISFEYGIMSLRFKLFPYYHIGYLYGWSTPNSKTIIRHYQDEEMPKGSWEVDRNRKAGQGTAGEKKIRWQFKSLPYLAGCRPSSSEEGVITFEYESVFPGLNFFTTGYAPRAFLMDMDGNILHEWSAEFKDIWPGPLQFPEREEHTHFWLNAHLFDNGDILAIFDGIGMIKLDQHSQLLWAYRGGCHHDIDITEDGIIYVLTHKVIHTIENLSVTEGILDDEITILTPEGKKLKSVSIIKSFMKSNYAPILNNMKRVGDALHTNSLQVITGDIAEKFPLINEGSVLISIRELNTIAVIDTAEEKVIWALSGMWARQHDATLMKNGNLLLFDNLGSKGQSKILEINPLTQEIVWEYPHNREVELFSKTSGACQRLPNGNTLITESNNGRVQEVTPDNRIVWEYVVPYRAGKNNELIANLFRVTRVPIDRSIFLLHGESGTP